MQKTVVKKLIWIPAAGVAFLLYFWGLNKLGEDAVGERPASALSDTMLVHGWRFFSGDVPDGASPALPDSTWPVLRSDQLPGSYHGEPAWFRLHLQAPPRLHNKPAAILMHHYGASEIYLDGILVASFGKVASDHSEEETIDPINFPVNIVLDERAIHLLAVRYSNSGTSFHRERFQTQLAGFEMHLVSAEQARAGELSDRIAIIVIGSIMVFLLTLSFIHLLLFLFYRSAIENFYYSLFSGCYSLLFLIAMIQAGASSDPSVLLWANNLVFTAIALLLFTLMLLISSIFKSRFPRWFWIISFISTGIVAVDSFADMLNEIIDVVCLVWLVLSCMAIMTLSIYQAWRARVRGVRILAAGIGTFGLFIFYILSLTFYSSNIGFSSAWVIIGLLAAMLSIPISMSVYLAYSVSATNKDLSLQKATLEIRVKERTREVVEQKKVIEEKNKDITDSINYARRIQDAILPSDDQVSQMLPGCFVLYRPKDIVSGDFYFFAESGSKVVVAAADCTGHGVPGAFMSMLGVNHLKRIVNEQQVVDTSRILDQLHVQVLHSINRDISKRDSKDGMDVALLSIDKLTGVVQFSGAVRPLYYFDNAGIHEVKGDRYSIAGVKEIGGIPYTSISIQVTEPTTFYIFSDGFADQFGGDSGKKLMSKNFKKLLESVQGKDMKDQRASLDSFFTEWKGGSEQMDDILVIGIRLT